MNKSVVAAITAAAILVCGTAGAVEIGSDGFDYPDGAIVNPYNAEGDLGPAGGTGWDWDNTTQTHTGTVSDWDNAFGNAYIENGALITDGGGALRQYNGPTESAADNPETDERLGAFRAAGSVYYGVTMTPVVNGDWFGMSGFDFGGERIFMGMPYQSGHFGIDISGVANTVSDIPVVWEQTYRLVGVIDFDGDQVRLWVDPDENDYDNGFADNTSDVQIEYLGTNWNTAIRLASGGQTVWDDVVVGTDFATVVPEPATLALLSLGGLLIARRRK